MKSKLTTVIFGLLILALFSVNSFGQSYKQRFNELFTEGDIAGQEKLLSEWEKSGGEDAEFYVAYFNYCVKNSKKESIWTSDTPAGRESLKLTGKAENGADVVAYMNFEANYDKKMLEKGFEVIDRGIQKHPKRLDMRFGEIYMYGETGDYGKFTSKIVDTVEYSQKIKNDWLWDNDKGVDNPEEFLLGSIQDYQVKLYNTGSDALLENMKRIAETVLKYYPEHVESLSNLSLVYSIQKKYDKALEVLLKAEQFAPRDCVVLNNIAHVYKIKGDTQKSLEYYMLITKYGNSEQKAIALKQITELTKK